MTDHRDAMLGEAERMVERAIARGADEAEVMLGRDEGIHVELERGVARHSGHDVLQGGCLRIIKDGRMGSAAFGQAGATEAVLDGALQAARHARKSDFAFPDPAAVEHIDRFDADTAAAPMMDVLALSTRLARSVAEILPDAALSGGVVLGADWSVLANSRGVSLAHRATMAQASATLSWTGSVSVSHWGATDGHSMALDVEAVAARVADETKSLGSPQDRGTSGAVVFAPEAACELLALAMAMARGEPASRGQSAWADRLGKQVATGLSFVDDPFHEDAHGAGWDGDGNPTRRNAIVEDGTLRMFLYDAWDAHRMGVASTGSAVRGGPRGTPTTGTHHVVVEGAAPKPLDALLSEVGEGVLVGSVIGAHTADVTTGAFSVTAPNLWRIEGGALAGAVPEAAIAGSLDELLQGCVGTSKQARPVGGMTAPYVATDGLQVVS